ALAGRPGCAGEGGARARTCNPLPGGFGHQPRSTTTTARGASLDSGTGGGGGHPLHRQAPSPEASPEAEPRTTTPPPRQNRGGTPIDVRLPYLGARPGP